MYDNIQNEEEEDSQKEGQQKEEDPLENPRIAILLEEERANPKVEEMIFNWAKFNLDIRERKMKDLKYHFPNEKLKKEIYTTVEKLLIECSLLNNKQDREKEILKTYQWYKAEIKKYYDLAIMKEFTAPQNNEIKNEDSEEEADEIDKEKDTKKLEHSKRTEFKNQINLKKFHVKKIIKVKSISNLNRVKKIEKSDNKSESDLSKSVNKVKLVTNASNMEDEDDKSNDNNIQPSWEFFTSKHDAVCKHCRKGKKKNNEKLQNPKREVKETYSVKRPKVEKQLMKYEKLILQEKNKRLAEARNEKEIQDNIKNFGQQKASYKSNVDKKYNMIEVVKIYKKQIDERKNDSVFMTNTNAKNTSFNQSILSGNSQVKEEKDIPNKSVVQETEKNIDENIIKEENKDPKLSLENLNLSQSDIEEEFEASQVLPKINSPKKERVISVRPRNLNVQTNNIIKDPNKEERTIRITLDINKEECVNKIIENNIQESLYQNESVESLNKFPRHKLPKILQARLKFGELIKSGVLAGKINKAAEIHFKPISYFFGKSNPSMSLDIGERKIDDYFENKSLKSSNSCADVVKNQFFIKRDTNLLKLRKSLDTYKIRDVNKLTRFLRGSSDEYTLRNSFLSPKASDFNIKPKYPSTMSGLLSSD